MKTAEKDWITLNEHGKMCLYTYIFAISALDLRTSQLDYLYKKELVDYQLHFPYEERKGRIILADHCLTDLGINTVKHYFPGAIK